MRKELKKLTAMMLVATMSISLLSGCGGSSSTKETTTEKSTKETTKESTTKSDSKKEDSTEETTKKASKDDEKSGDYTDYSEGFDEKVTIKIPVYDRAFEGWDVTNNYYTKWIQSEFGEKYNVDVQFVAIGRTTEVQDYTQMLAAGTAPDIIFHYDMPQAVSYYNEGAMQELDLDEIKYYAPTYYENLSSTIEDYGKIDDGIYFFFGERPTADNFISIIRKDWIDQVGLEMPTNLDEYNTLLSAWKDAGLGNGGGSLIQNNFTYDYAFRDWPVDEDSRALYSDLSVAALTKDWKPTYDFLKNLNYQYNNGLIDKEFYLNIDDAATQADFVSGNSGIYGSYLTSSSTVISSLLQNDPNAEVAYLPASATVPEGNKPQGRAYWPFGMIMGINTKASDEARQAIWMYLEWMSQEDNLFYLQNGVEGENYNLEDGLAVPVADYSGESVLSKNNNKDYWCLVIESAVYEDKELNHKAQVYNWSPAGYEQIVEDAIADKEANLEYQTPDVLFTTTISSIAEYKADLNELWKELYVKCAMASEGDFDSVYEDACQQFLDAGYQEILDEKQGALDNGDYK